MSSFLDRRMFFDWNGNPMTLEEWTRAFDRPRHVADTYFPVRDREYRVSTVWLGLDHGWGDKPIIFESMAWDVTPMLTPWESLPTSRDMEMFGFQDRYSTAAEARRGHVRMIRQVKKWARATFPRPVSNTKQLISNGRKP